MNRYINKGEHDEFNGINVSAPYFDLYSAKPIEFIRFDEPISFVMIWESVRSFIQKLGIFRSVGEEHE